MDFKTGFAYLMILVIAFVMSELILNWLDSISLPRQQIDRTYLK